jgi:leader peptidase (prepilin peptidase)/N-methyltransferase
MILIALIIISASLGSFGNNVISSYIDQKFDLKRSVCLCGKKQLSFIELIPILSYIFYRRRCKTCGIIIPCRYVIVEVSFIAVSLASYYLTGLGWELLLTCLTYFILIIILFIDLAKLIIPNMLLMILIPLLLFKQFTAFDIRSIITSIVVTGFLIIYNTVSFRNRGYEVIGWGDIKLLFILLIIFEFPMSVIAIWFAAFTALLSMGLKGINNSKLKLPFGSHIAFSFIVISLSNKLLEYYAFY